MLMEGARNLSPCLDFSHPWGRKSMGTPNAEDWLEALRSDVPALLVSCKGCQVLPC